MQPQTPTGPASHATVTAGMTVVDTNGEPAGTVTAVQQPGTDVRPDLAAGLAEELMVTGYVRIDGTGALSNDTYAGNEQIGDVAPGDPGVVTLNTTRGELYRAL